MHRGLDRLDTLASLRDGLIERGLEPLIGFEQRMPIIPRGIGAKVFTAVSDRQLLPVNRSQRIFYRRNLDPAKITLP